ncbi:hypothetical protein FSP39_013365 [Pinctada imbricata]|uniref:SGNH hydrolase-type esterase domain-containing protein n=1 Tax=Pinctada imbricata TaxID=66713 RepID=A0AA88YTP3_PINIB|nr:hypothetical protein FSP39_012169 [Pinctada imbricata]KAK3107383.1 hypothetical protein FSP39_013365 [Pinctada imbricata]
MAKFGLLGSSYVSRLSRYMHHDMRLPGYVAFWGRGGMKTDNIPEEIWEEIADFKPNCIFMHIGGNDISATVNPRDVAKRILDIRDSLIEKGVKTVFVGEIVRRRPSQKYTPGLTAQEFDRLRKIVNSALKKRLGKNLIRFKDISFPNDYCDDLIHFSDKKTGRCGIEKYMFHVRRCLLSFRLNAGQ